MFQKIYFVSFNGTKFIIDSVASRSLFLGCAEDLHCRIEKSLV